MDFSNENFSQNECESCLKVLNALKDEPFLNPDNKTFSGLITKIHKNAKKQNRQESYSEMKNHDLEINSGSVLMKKLWLEFLIFMMIKKRYSTYKTTNTQKLLLL